MQINHESTRMNTNETKPLGPDIRVAACPSVVKSVPAWGELIRAQDKLAGAGGNWFAPWKTELRPVGAPRPPPRSPLHAGHAWKSRRYDPAVERGTGLFPDPANASRRFIPLPLADCKVAWRRFFDQLGTRQTPVRCAI